MPSYPNLHPDALVALRRLVGRTDAEFREGQFQAISALAGEGARVLVVQRTGWGKSAVYFVATALLRARGAGPTLIVSPLLALMRDQVAAAERAGIRAATMNSSNSEDWDTISEQLAADAVDVLLVSPERLNNPRFRSEHLPRLAHAVGLLVIDEAHCISDWGHDFRPDYRRIRDLLTGLPPSTAVLATTATANQRVERDVAEQLAVGHGGTPAEVVTHRGPLARPSLRAGVLRLPEPAARLAWLAEHLGDLSGSGIIYCLTVSAATDTAEFLRARGHDVQSYTGKTDPGERLDIEQALRDNRLKAVVATSALGMGFDKPDLGFVVHMGAPSSPVAYYQQVGRAGRAVERADILLLPGSDDRHIWRYLAGVSMPQRDQAEAVLAALESAQRPLSTAALESAVDVRRARLELLLKVLDVDGAVQRVDGGWIATGTPWQYDEERYARVAATRATEQAAMLAYLDTDQCRMAFIARQLDDPAAAPCGRCDRCTGAWFDADVGAETKHAADAWLTRAGVEFAARSMWPSGMARLQVPLRGRIPPGESAATGRAIGRLSDPGWGARLRDILDGAGNNGGVPDTLIQAATEVLAGWDWAERPVAVTAVPSRARPELATGLGFRLAELGRLSWLGPLALIGDGPSGQSGGNSAFRLAALWGRIVVPAEMRAALASLDGPVLLVDDLVDSRWTMTVAARELRLAGATAVLPFAVALSF